jgi:phosphatidylethanolamine-binding protein (PEBP) family uncharacterized protein
LKLKPGATKEQVEAAMEGQVLEKTELMGRYVRKKKYFNSILHGL